MNPSPLRRVLRALTFTALGAFAAWMALYGMVFSALIAALTLSATLSGRRRLALALWAVSLVAVPLWGLPEYAAATNRLHCRALAWQGRTPSADCDAEDVARGRAIARDGSPLLTTRERLAVHGFNHLLALGGLVALLPEVAWETARLSWVSDPLASDHGSATAAPYSARLAQCSADASAALGPEVTRHSDFPARSPRLRAALARLVAALPERPGATRSAPVHFVSGGRDNAAYLDAWRAGEVRVGLALEVPDSRLTVRRLEDGGVEATWSGTIGYPAGDIAFAAPMPTLLGPRVLRVSEAVFCAMHADGAMNPYPLTWTWRVEG